MSTDDAEIGLVSPTPRWTIPYSVSMPTTFWMATTARYPDVSPTGSQRWDQPNARRASSQRPKGRMPAGTAHRPARGPDRRRPHAGGRGHARPAAMDGCRTSQGSQVLAGGHPLDGAAAGGLLVLALAEQDPQEDDALALLAGDLGPVVGVGGVRQVLVLLVLLPDRVEQVLGADALALARDLALDGQLLGPAHDVLDHGSRREVLEVHDFFVAVLVGHLDEPVVVVGRVHLLDRLLDHRLDRLGPIAAAQRLDLAGVQRQVGGQVAGEDLRRGPLV